MGTIIEQYGACRIAVTRLRSPDGHPVIHLKIMGGGTAMDTALCLDRLTRTPAFTGIWLAMVDFRESSSPADADGIFQQAAVLRRAGFKRLALSYRVDSEAMAAIISMVEEVFNAAGLPTGVAIHTTEAEALEWLDTQAEQVPA